MPLSFWIKTEIYKHIHRLEANPTKLYTPIKVWYQTKTLQNPITYDKEKYREMLLDTTETVLGYFGFDRILYGNKKNISKRKWRWFEELRQERDINVEM